MENTHTIAKRIDAIGFIHNDDLAPRFDKLLSEARPGGFVIFKVMTPEETFHTKDTGTGRLTPRKLRKRFSDPQSKNLLPWVHGRAWIGGQKFAGFFTNCDQAAFLSLHHGFKVFGIKTVELTPLGDVLVTVWPVPPGGSNFKPSPIKRRIIDGDVFRVNQKRQTARARERRQAKRVAHA